MKNKETTPPLIMGVLNITPDSFSDGGRYVEASQALNQVESMLNAGADIIDIGGQSSRPGAIPVTAEMELERIIPIIESMRKQFGDVKISVDTYRYDVMRVVLKYNNIWMLNDISAFDSIEKRALAQTHNVNICLMHMQNNPETMQNNPTYPDVVSDVYSFLADRIQTCTNDGIDLSRIFIDPGFGFGKTLTHNIALLKSLSKLTTLTPQLLVGLSRKAMIGTLTGKSVDQRQYGSVAAATIAHLHGARVLRVHDVAATKDALAISYALLSA